MTKRIAVHVEARDPVSRAGIEAQLRGRPEVHLVNGEGPAAAEVAVVVVDEVDDHAVQAMKALQRAHDLHVLVVGGRVDEVAVLAAAEAGVSGVIRRSDAEPEMLVRAVRSAAGGEGVLPGDLVGRLLGQVGRLQRQVLAPNGLTMTGLRAREVDVLRLVADGLSTAEIATRLRYSDRTIKNVIHDIIVRLNLRNRAHAVAWAVKEGLI